MSQSWEERITDGQRDRPELIRPSAEPGVAKKEWTALAENVV